MTDSLGLLHVDPREETREAAASRLGGIDDRFDVQGVRTAAAAERRFDPASIDCVLSASDLPDAAVSELISWIRDRDPELPVVIYAGDTVVEDRAAVLEAGATDYRLRPQTAADYEFLGRQLARLAEEHRAREADVTDGLDRAYTGNDPNEDEKLETLASEGPFRDAPVMIAVTRAVDGVPVVEDCNRRFAAELGYSRSELRGRELAELYSPESTERLLDRGGYDRGLRGEFAIEGRTLVTRDGERLPTLLQAIPRYKDDTVVGTVATYVDRTERKQAQQVVQQANAMEASMDGMAILDSNDEYVYVNQAHVDVYGYGDREAFLGNSWRMLYDDEEIERFESEVVPIIESEGRWRGTATGLRADGTTFPQELSLTRFEDGSLVCVVRDVTDRMRRQRRIETQRDTLETLTQIIRHDIRNVLQPVSGYAEILRERVGPKDERYVEAMLVSIDSAIETTRMAGAVTRTVLEDSMDSSSTRLRPVLEGAIDETRVIATPKQITVDGPIPDVEVSGDEMLGSVFGNLLDNAIEHNDSERPEITVSAEARDDRVEIRIADDGPGVPDDRKEAIFEQGVSDDAGDGTGLGLYLVRTLIDRYGGDVWVEDRTDGRDRSGESSEKHEQPSGAVFVVELPIASEEV